MTAMTPMTIDDFRRKLLALWTEAEEGDPANLQNGSVRVGNPKAGRDYHAWAGATKDLLLALGMEWSNEICQGGDYDFATLQVTKAKAAKTKG